MFDGNPVLSALIRLSFQSTSADSYTISINLDGSDQGIGGTRGAAMPSFLDHYPKVSDMEIIVTKLIRHIPT